MHKAYPHKLFSGYEPITLQQPSNIAPWLALILKIINPK